MNLGFESFVNSEECKTVSRQVQLRISLRALLIQKSVKPYEPYGSKGPGLRALLIQKSVKQVDREILRYVSLRALLIQKSVKHP